MLQLILVRLPAAHYNTYFYNLTHTLSHSFHLSSSSSFQLPVSLYLSISPFYFLVQLVLPRYSRKGTLHWRAAECQEFFEHFDWLRVEWNGVPSLPIGPGAHINNAPSMAHPCVAVTIDQG